VKPSARDYWLVAWLLWIMPTYLALKLLWTGPDRRTDAFVAAVKKFWQS
jgi:hypothetical protein